MIDTLKTRAAILQALGPMSTKRSVDQLVGLCAGVIADGVLNDQEVATLTAWIVQHGDIAHEWPCSVLYARLASALEDGMIDENERRDLLRIIVGISSGTLPAQLAPGAGSAVSDLPFDNPVPAIAIPTRTFVLTGELAIGPRATVMQAIADRGGENHKSVQRATHYLVVGSLGSGDWRHSGFGNKIVKAVELRTKGTGIVIVPEKQFAEALAA